MQINNYSVLVAMETSGKVRDAFIAKGHNAISCDLLPTDSPGPHYQGDVYDILFSHNWDLIIAHPECTKLCVSGNSTYAKGKPKHQERLNSIAWTQKFWNDCKSQALQVCFENPIGVLTTQAKMPKPQYIQPWMFGHKESKKTALFLFNLPKLKETSNVLKWKNTTPENEWNKMHYMGPSKDRWKLRSETYQGIADAMAEQWG